MQAGAAGQAQRRYHMPSARRELAFWHHNAHEYLAKLRHANFCLILLPFVCVLVLHRRRPLNLLILAWLGCSGLGSQTAPEDAAIAWRRNIYADGMYAVSDSKHMMLLLLLLLLICHYAIDSRRMHTWQPQEHSTVASVVRVVCHICFRQRRFPITASKCIMRLSMMFARCEVPAAESHGLYLLSSRAQCC